MRLLPAVTVPSVANFTRYFEALAKTEVSVRARAPSNFGSFLESASNCTQPKSGLSPTEMQISLDLALKCTAPLGFWARLECGGRTATFGSQHAQKSLVGTFINAYKRKVHFQVYGCVKSPIHVALYSKLKVTFARIL